MIQAEELCYIRRRIWITHNLQLETRGGGGGGGGEKTLLLKVLNHRTRTQRDSRRVKSAHKSDCHLQLFVSHLMLICVFNQLNPDKDNRPNNKQEGVERQAGRQVRPDTTETSILIASYTRQTSAIRGSLMRTQGWVAIPAHRLDKQDKHISSLSITCGSRAPRNTRL